MSLKAPLGRLPSPSSTISLHIQLFPPSRPECQTKDRKDNSNLGPALSFSYRRGFNEASDFSSVFKLLLHRLSLGSYVLRQCRFGPLRSLSLLKSAFRPIFWPLHTAAIPIKYSPFLDQDEWIAPSVVLLSLVSKEGKILQVCACVLCRKRREKKRTASRARSRGYPCTEIRRKKGNFSSWRGKGRERESVGQGQDKASQWGGRPFILYQTLGLLPLKLLQSFKLSPGAEREKGKS